MEKKSGSTNSGSSVPYTPEYQNKTVRDHIGRDTTINLLLRDDNMALSKENSQSDTDTPVESQEENQEFLFGIKLFLIMFSLTLATFLMLLDASVVATVS
jgi:hypothetical protein